MGAFANSIRAFALKKKADHDAVVRKVVFDLSTKVIKASPVDTGRFRANWQYGYGVKPEGTLDAVDLSSDGSSTRDDIAGQVTKGAGVHYLVNNLPYAEVLEYGYYPDPPKYGTYLKKGVSKHGYTGPGYMQRSAGGFSKQAPRGMVGISVMDVANDLQRIAQEVTP